MNRKPLNAWQHRRAFTLIELLVVIAIIAILASLILAGVMALLRKGPETLNRNDILQLSAGMQKFKTKYGFYPPSQLVLRSNAADYLPAEASSVACLNAMFPSLGAKNPLNGVVYWTGINWGNRTGATAPVFGSAANPTADPLDGDQCLVFFLGGIPNGVGSAPLGFSVDATNPASLAGDRLKFLDFDSARVQLVHAGNPFPSYLDSYYRAAPTPKPFIYFSSNRRPNGYDTTANTFGVLPYVEKTVPTKQYYLPSQFQIISAGLDGQFGTGGVALPVQGTGKDDMSNFSDSMLGVAP